MTPSDFRVMGWISFVVLVGMLIPLGILGLISLGPPPAPEKPTNYEICVSAGGTWTQSDNWYGAGDCTQDGKTESYGT